MVTTRVVTLAQIESDVRRRLDEMASVYTYENFLKQPREYWRERGDWEMDDLHFSVHRLLTEGT